MLEKRNRMALPPGWIHYAACAWTVLFGAPHVWWALGIPAGFPGGTGAHEAMFRQTWFLFYDLIVVALCGIAIVVALAPVRSWGRVIPRWILRTAAWIACAMLLFRGLAGMIVDGPADLVWWPTFLTGGILFRGVARSVMAKPASAGAVAPLLVAQRVDRIEPRSLPGRVVAEEDPDRGGEAEGE